MSTSKSSLIDARRRKGSGNDDEASPDPRPGTVTAIHPQARDPTRVSVFVDGAFSFGVARDVASDFGLTTNRVLDETELSDVLAREQLRKATNVALNFLAYRQRSEGEIRRRLGKGGFPEATIELTLDKLRELHYVDDPEFARRWIENRGDHRPRGARLLAQELKVKGIDQEILSAALEEADLDERSDALTLARDRAQRMTGLQSSIRERRLSGFLARRGYGFEVIRATLNILREEAGNESPESE